MLEAAVLRWLEYTETRTDEAKAAPKEPASGSQSRSSKFASDATDTIRS